MAGHPLTDGQVWTGTVDGRPWEISGSGLVADVFEPTFKLELAEPTTTWNVWGSWVDKTAYLQSFSFNRAVSDWSLGPRAASGTVTLENTDGDHPGTVGGAVRISVTVPSGTFIIFNGYIHTKQHNLSGDNYPTIDLFISDWYGYNAQKTFDVRFLTGTALKATDVWITWMITVMGMSGSADTTHWDSSGFSQRPGTGKLNIADLMKEFIIGELGMLWVTRIGTWGYRASGWWNNNRTTAVAAIGSDAGTPPDTYTYRLPLAKVTPAASSLAISNDITWSNANAVLGPYTSNVLDTTSRDTYELRVRSDAVHVDLVIDAGNQLTLLLAHKKDPWFYKHQVVIPADLSSDAMEYAARAEITDFVNVASESLEGYWQSWSDAHVMGVAHSWSPTQGWYLTLDTTRELFEDEEE